MVAAYTGTVGPPTDPIRRATRRFRLVGRLTMAGLGGSYSFQARDDFDFQRIRYEKAGYRATVTLNRPQVYNALDFQTLKECSAAFADASYDDRVAVVVVTGAGDRAFCTGADLKEQEQF